MLVFQENVRDNFTLVGFRARSIKVFEFEIEKESTSPTRVAVYGSGVCLSGRSSNVCK